MRTAFKMARQLLTGALAFLLAWFCASQAAFLTQRFEADQTAVKAALFPGRHPTYSDSARLREAVCQTADAILQRALVYQDTSGFEAKTQIEFYIGEQNAFLQSRIDAETFSAQRAAERNEPTALQLEKGFLRRETDRSGKTYFAVDEDAIVQSCRAEYEDRVEAFKLRMDSGYKEVQDRLGALKNLQFAVWEPAKKRLFTNTACKGEADTRQLFEEAPNALILRGGKIERAAGEAERFAEALRVQTENADPQATLFLSFPADLIFNDVCAGIKQDFAQSIAQARKAALLLAAGAAALLGVFAAALWFASRGADKPHRFSDFVPNEAKLLLFAAACVWLSMRINRAFFMLLHPYEGAVWLFLQPARYVRLAERCCALLALLCLIFCCDLTRQARAGLILKNTLIRKLSHRKKKDA